MARLNFTTELTGFGIGNPLCDDPERRSLLLEILSAVDPGANPVFEGGAPKTAHPLNVNVIALYPYHSQPKSFDIFTRPLLSRIVNRDSTFGVMKSPPETP